VINSATATMNEKLPQEGEKPRPNSLDPEDELLSTFADLFPDLDDDGHLTGEPLDLSTLDELDSQGVDITPDVVAAEARRQRGESPANESDTNPNGTSESAIQREFLSGLSSTKLWESIPEAVAPPIDRVLYQDNILPERAPEIEKDSLSALRHNIGALLLEAGVDEIQAWYITVVANELVTDIKLKHGKVGGHFVLAILTTSDFLIYARDNALTAPLINLTPEGSEVPESQSEVVLIDAFRRDPAETGRGTKVCNGLGRRYRNPVAYDYNLKPVAHENYCIVSAQAA
jgi:hypothetical protein